MSLARDGCRLALTAALAALSCGALDSAGQQPGEAAPAAVAASASPEEAGDEMMAHQRYQAAIQAFKQEAHKSADVWNKMGIAHQMMFANEEAAKCYQESLRLAPKNAHVLNNLATVYDSMKQFSTAERLYRKALRIEPRSALILRNLGTNQLSQRKFKKGADAYQAALTIDPEVFDPNANPKVDNPSSVQDRGAMNYYMARSCLHAGLPDRSIDYLRRALNEGYTTAKKLAGDREFASLHGVAAFEQLLADQSAH